MSHRIGLRGAGRLRRALSLSAFFALLLASPAALAEEPPAAAEAAGNVRPSFLVTEIAVGEGVGIEAAAARDALAARFGRLRGKLDVRSYGELKSALDQQALLQLLGEETADLATVGGYVDVDRIVFGRIHKVGGLTEVSVRVFHVREATMEMAMARRIAPGKDDSLVLAVLDSLADRLAAWALTTYGDAEPSSKFAELKGKKPSRAAAELPAEAVEAGPPPSPWSFLGVSGAGLAGVGLGVAGVGAALTTVEQKPDNLALPIGIMATGAAMFFGGMALVVFDGLE
jgi:hypothetical protein